MYENLPSKRISLVLPAFNEEDNIIEAIGEAGSALRDLAVAHEVLVVDDGSRDSTAARVEREFADVDSVRVVRHPRNLGYGAALRTGFSAARYDLVAFTDADRQFHLEDLRLLLEVLPGHDAACGYRIDRQDHWLRLLYSRCYNLVVRSLLGLSVRDCDCALKLFRRSMLDGLEIRTNGFLVNAEVLTRLEDRGASIVEAGVRHRPRIAGRSTVSPLHAFPVLADLLRFWWSDRLFPAADPLADGALRYPVQSISMIRVDKRLSAQSS